MLYFLSFIIFLHGVLHLLGFTNAFAIGALAKLDSHIPKPIGIIWLGVALMFFFTAFLIILDSPNWWVVSGVALLFSQVLIIGVWEEARFGTILNTIILIVVVIAWGYSQFENKFRQDVRHSFTRNITGEEKVTESDLQGLPPPVQKYLRLSGVLNKPKVKNMHLVFEGQMRERGEDYFSFTSEQYNFFDTPARYFYMKANLFGMTVPGYHRFTGGQASMDIRLVGLYPIVRHNGNVMNKTETVTFFNDMCLLAPATLIDKRIRWHEIDDRSVEAVFQLEEVVIKAVLYFNEEGRLINFVSDDRTDINEMKQFPFSTPVSGYEYTNGQLFITGGQAIWEYPDGKFTYGIFKVRRIEYNVAEGP